ncbi:MAG: helicase [Xanthobacteraceae bacterium]|nr:MAG: helicase [Xanthobacteraceae bacterium]
MALLTHLPPGSGDRAPGSGVTAVLGPTNTGKTHLAIDRMLAHSSGIIGLPLRLLAREVYNKVASRAGADAVALITGEEKIKPPRPRYWVSTVEAMPRDLDVSFLAVDEIQIGADLERGHVFTDRILHRRGRDETLILGAATMRPIVERLLPGASIVTRPRLSQLDFAGDRKITRQPRRTAIVAFSADEVYAIAELIRRQHGGAAVVLGALSPRTRNAQVALYQSGDVDFLVATDAIGMGLNLDVDHVAFASDRKYDGYQYRRLAPSEFAQIAGRAGRATRDGTFGTTGRCAPFEPELVNALQNHAFDSVKLLQWRNASLDFASLGALQASLAQVPAHEALTRAPVGDDIRVLDHAARDDEVRAIARDRVAVERLWDVCQLPDYRKIAAAAHAELVVTLYGFLMRRGSLPSDWFATQVAQADRTDGDIDTLSARIAHIRTWTFAANRPDWLDDPDHWQETTRAVEDRLSDALHERLTERFVDRRTSVLMRRLRENTMLDTEIGKTGEVIVEGHVIGRLDGFLFAPDAAEAGSEAKALQAAAQKALAGEIDARAQRLAQAADDQFALASDGVLRWIGAAVGKLTASEDTLRPRLRILADERLMGAPHEAVQARLDLWLKTHIEKLLTPLFDLTKAEDITGIARGIAYQLVEALGVIERHRISSELKGLDQPARASLRKYGVRFGAYHVYVPALLKPAPRALALLLWSLKHETADAAALGTAQHLASSGRTSFAIDKDLDRDAYRLLGYRVCGERAVRVDILERLADLIRPALGWRTGAPGERPAGAFDGSAFIVTQAMTSLTGSAGEDFASILRALGYRMERRPKPSEPEPVAVPAQAAEVAAEHDAAGETAVLPEPETAPDAPVPDQPEAGAPDQMAVPDRPEANAPPDAAGADIQAESEAKSEADAAMPAAEAQADSAASAAATEAAEPELIEVWRPGRFEDAHPRRERHRAGRRGRETAAGGEAAAAPPEGEAQEPRKDGWRRRGHGRDQKDQGKGHGKRQGERGGEQPGERFQRRAGAPQGAGEAAARERPGRNRDQSRGRERERFPHKGGPDRVVASSGPRERRDKVADPNSPFAKLAALKAQLEAGSKEPS